MFMFFGFWFCSYKNALYFLLFYFLSLYLLRENKKEKRKQNWKI
jgi:hypothetical protein